MAYKFQLGAARLGGSITADGTLSGTAADFNDGDVTNVGDISADKIQSDDNAVGLTLAASGADHMVLVGNQIDVKQNMQISGATQLRVRDAVFEGSNANELRAHIANSSGHFRFEINSTEELRINSTGIIVDNQMSASTISLDSAAGIAGVGLTNNAGVLDASNVPNSALANDSISLTAGAGLASIGVVALGATASVAVDGVLEDLDTLGAASNDGEFIVATGAGVFAYESGNTARTSLGLGTGDSPTFTGLTLTGDLQVQGTTTTIDSTTLTVADINIVVGQGGSGSLDGLGLSFGSAGGVETLQTQDSGSTPKLGSSLPLSASTYYGDGSNLSGVAAANASSLRLNGADAVVNSNITASNDVILVDTSAARIIEMPDITSGDVGQMYIIKDIIGSGSTYPIEIRESDSNHDLDGAASIEIESNYGAVNLMACSSSFGFFYSIF